MELSSIKCITTQMHISYKTNISFLICILLLLDGCQEKKGTQQAFSPKFVGAQEVLTFLHNLLQEPELKAASLSFYVSPLEKDSAIVSYMPETALATASTLKAVTTATALGILGEDFRFTTKIAYTGKIDNNDGTLYGNLYLIGSGDPTFGSDNMSSLMDFLANRVLEKGIKKIEGKLIGDASVFDDAGIANTWIWEDIGNYYGAAPLGLNIHQNQYSIYFKTGSSIGQATEVIEVTPRIDGLIVENQVTTGKKYSGDNAYIYGDPNNYRKIIKGTLPPNRNRFMIKGAIPEPAKFCTFQFYKALQNKGVKISDQYEVVFQQKKIPEGVTLIYQHKSEPLSEIIKQTNFKSINLYADALIKKIGYEKTGKGTYETGIEALIEYWSNQKVETNGLLIHDGSGLSRYNAISAHTLTDVIRHTILKDSTDTFISSLPKAGISGTLKSICKNNRAKGRIAAKSGYIKNVRAYTGVVNTYSNKKLVFTILLNNHTKSYRALTPHIEELFNMLTRL